jgi:hypothetical protein
MKAYSYFLIFTLLLNHQANAMDASEHPHTSPLAYPAIPLDPKLAEKLFVNTPEKTLNCTTLFNPNWISPNGTAQAICNDAQLACLHYGLLTQKARGANASLLQELNHYIAMERQIVGLRLRTCLAILEATIIEGKTLTEAAGYPSAGSPFASYSTGAKQAP